MQFQARPAPPPTGFVDYFEFKKRVCAYLFPTPQDDQDLRDLLEAAQKNLTLAASEMEDWPTKKFPSSMNMRHGQSKEVVKMSPQLAAVRQSLSELRHVVLAIEQGSFSREVAFAPVDPAHKKSGKGPYADWLAHQKPPLDPINRLSSYKSRELPSSAKASLGLGPLWYKRIARFVEFVQDALATGNLRAYWLSPISGVTPFPNSNVWYDDEMANEALKTGYGKPIFGHPPVRMVFDSKEIDILCPPPTVASGGHQKRGAPKDLKQSIRRVLNHLCPYGYPASAGTKADLRRRVAKRLGKDTLSDRTFNRVLDEHNAAVGCE